MSPPPLFWHFLPFLLLNYHIIYLSSITSFPSLFIFYVLIKSLALYSLLMLNSFLCSSWPWFFHLSFFFAFPRSGLFSKLLGLDYSMPPFPCDLPFLCFLAFSIFCPSLHRALVPSWCSGVAMLWTCRNAYKNGHCSLLRFFCWWLSRFL